MDTPSFFSFKRKHARLFRIQAVINADEGVVIQGMIDQSTGLWLYHGCLDARDLGVNVLALRSHGPIDFHARLAANNKPVVLHIFGDIDYIRGTNTS